MASIQPSSPTGHPQQRDYPKSMDPGIAQTYMKKCRRVNNILDWAVPHPRLHASKSQADNQFLAIAQDGVHITPGGSDILAEDMANAVV